MMAGALMIFSVVFLVFACVLSPHAAAFLVAGAAAGALFVGALISRRRSKLTTDSLSKVPREAMAKIEKKYSREELAQIIVCSASLIEVIDETAEYIGTGGSPPVPWDLAEWMMGNLSGETVLVMDSLEKFEQEEKT